MAVLFCSFSKPIQKKNLRNHNNRHNQRFVSYFRSMSLSHQQLHSLAAEFGTPLYVYDAAHITAQYQKLTDAFAQEGLVAVAMVTLGVTLAVTFTCIAFEAVDKPEFEQVILHLYHNADVIFVAVYVELVSAADVLL